MSAYDPDFRGWLDRLIELQAQGLAVSRECLAWQRRRDREEPEGEAILTRMKANGSVLKRHWEARPEWQDDLPSDVRLRIRHFCEQREAVVMEMQDLYNARSRTN